MVLYHIALRINLNIMDFSFFKICIVILASLITGGCLNNNSISLSSNDVFEIRSSYTPEEINYFYLTAFSIDPEGNVGAKRNLNNHLLKWQNNILIRLKGDYSQEDSLFVESACSKINQVGLPISISIAEQNDIEKVNMVVSFEPIESIRSSGFGSNKKHIRLARGHFFISNGEMHADIQIPNNVVLSADEKKSVILEEITQCLGIPGDSYIYPKSIFYQGKNSVTELSQIDKRVLKILYEPFISIGLSRSSFYKSFNDILPSFPVCDTDYFNFEEFIKRGCFSYESIQEFLAISFDTNKFSDISSIQKWMGPIVLDVTDERSFRSDSLVLTAIDTINKYSNVEIHLYKKSNCSGSNATLRFQDVQYSNKPSYFTWREVSNLANIYHICNGEMNISEKSVDTSLFPYLISRQMFILLGLNFPDRNIGDMSYIFERPGPDGSYLSSVDREALSIFFNPVIKNGMERSRIERILNKYYPHCSKVASIEDSIMAIRKINKGVGDCDYDACLDSMKKMILLDCENNEGFRKIVSNIWINVKGKPSESNLGALSEIVCNLNELNLGVNFEILKPNMTVPNLEIYFIDKSNYVEFFSDSTVNLNVLFKFKNGQLNHLNNMRLFQSRIIIDGMNSKGMTDLYLWNYFLEYLLEGIKWKEFFFEIDSIKKEVVLSENMKSFLQKCYQSKSTYIVDRQQIVDFFNENK